MSDWEELHDFQDYEINDQGQIRNKKTGKILSASSNGKGVLKVVLTQNGRIYTRSVARLVARQFIGEPEEGFTVVHKDEDYSNLAASNLEWKPRWFAQKRAMQSKRNIPLRRGRILRESTGKIYENSLECAKDIDGIEDYIIICAADPDNRLYMGSTYRWVRD
jgi:hypothetical protein